MWQVFFQTSLSYTAAGFCVGQPACSEVVTHGVWQQRATGVPTRDDLQVSVEQQQQQQLNGSGGRTMIDSSIQTYATEISEWLHSEGRIRRSG